MTDPQHHASDITSKASFWPQALIIVIVALAVWAFPAVIIYQSYIAASVPSGTEASSLPNMERLGQLGDSFGWLNSLFSMLAFAVIAASLILQRQDLQATLHEIHESTKAQKDLAASAQSERHHRITSLGLTFFSAEFRTVRENAWTLRNIIWRQINAEPAPDEQFHVLNGLAKAWIGNDYSAYETAAKSQDVPQNADRALSQILEFYVFFADYCHDETEDVLVERLNYYRYPFWRGVIRVVRDACHERYVGLTGPQRAVFPEPLWIEKLDRIEEIFSKRHPYNRDDDPIV